MTLSLLMYYTKQLAEAERTYFLGTPHYSLEEVNVGTVQWREVGLAVIDQEVVELLLALQLAGHLVDIDPLEIALIHVLLGCYTKLR